jgi:paraquat-inducible protein A
MARDLSAATLHRLSRGPDRLLGLALLASAALLLAGLLAPSLTVRSMIFFGEDISILRALGVLLRRGELVLFAVIALFSIVFPALKLLIAVRLLYFADARSRHLRRTIRWMEKLGKWSMLDVFVVALIVVAVNLSLVSDVAIHAGIYLFGASVLLSMFALGRIERLAQATLGHPSAEAPGGLPRRSSD